MPTSLLLDVEESLAKAISAEEIFNMPKPSQPSAENGAFDLIAPHLVNFSQRPGITYGTYRTDKNEVLRGEKFRKGRKNRAPDEKSGNVDFKRLLCKLCLPEYHLFRECPKLTPAKRIQL